MRDSPPSNMASRQYCPKCDSFNLKRLQRGYFKRVILKRPITFICRECYEEVSEGVLMRNEVREVPLFISQS